MELLKLEDSTKEFAQKVLEQTDLIQEMTSFIERRDQFWTTNKRVTMEIDKLKILTDVVENVEIVFDEI